MLSDRIDAINEKATSTQSSLELLSDDIDDIESQIDKINDEIDDLKERSKTLEKSSEAIKQVTELVFREKLEKYVELVNDGLSSIFFDREMEFDVEIDDRGSKKTVSLLYRRQEDGAWSEWREVDNSCGGNIRSVLDILSRIFLITVNDRNRVLFLDESFTEVSSRYVEPMVDFLEQITEKLGFDILLISHDERFLQALESVENSNIYEMEAGELEKQ